ncbi:Nucleosomal histone H3-Lys79 methylase [Trapelia coarctata]|nr:Nucleosomal histone H3-Lys79 methylase [Trapelia coarctata]
MSFNFMLKGSSAKVQNLQIRKEVVTTKPAAPSRALSGPQRPNASNTPKSNSKETNGAANGKVGKASPNQLKVQKRAPVKRRTPSEATPAFSSDDSDEESPERPAKKAKAEAHDLDTKRRVRCREAFSEDKKGDLSMVHAADITSLDRATKYVLAFEGASESSEVILQYPSASPRERYLLVKPKIIKSDNNDFNALEDIIHVMRQVIDHYLPPEQRDIFDDDRSGFPQRLNRSVHHKSEEELRKVIDDWNKALQELVDEGIIAKALDEWHSIHPKLAERILSQACARTVSLGVKSLREYENGTDNVYGELLPRFVSKILREDTHMKSDQVFIDLGSGVGNVVLQAALEVGCESWGCEMMKNSCNLAETQQKEFQARCRLWGLKPGEIHLERGDFLTNTAIAKVIPRADVVLVNNQAFTPELNERLTSLFLDLKEGARIVSLKSFVPAGRKISARNLNSPFNVLEPEQKEYYSECVSWTDAPGTYYVSRKDTRKIRAFAARNK